MPESINHFQQLNSATICRRRRRVAGRRRSSSCATTLQQVAPSGYNVDYSGQSRQFVQESGGFVVTLLFAIVIVFLALAAQFESFRDPMVILVSVPMALFGALMFINLGFATLNIYTQVGLVTLLGLISKHGILIVQFANELQRAGTTKRDGDRRGGGGATAPDPDDDRRDGVGRGAAGDRLRRGRGGPACDGPRDVHRLVDRHAVHAVHRAGRVHPPGCRSRQGSSGQGRRAYFITGIVNSARDVVGHRCVTHFSRV